MIRVLFVFLAIVTLSGCTELQFASHVFKKGNNSGGPVANNSASSSQGLFKIGKPYVVEGQTYYPKENYDLVETGIASWYGPGFHGSKTANGEKFDTNELTAAHRTLQMPSLVRVTNLENGRSVIVRVNDRGPFARNRVIDLSSRAADLLDFKAKGTAKVRLEVLSKESLQIAQMAKSGQSTKGVEIAMNQGGRLTPPSGTTIPASGAYQTASNQIPAGAGTGVPQDSMITAEPLSAASVPVHQDQDGRLMPDPVVTQLPVRPSNIYIQAGSFTVYDNAQRLKSTLSATGNSSIQAANIGGRQFYRVRVGPVPDVQSADQMLNRVVAMGNSQAIIVVD